MSATLRDSAMATLRRQTRAAHESLESAVDLHRLVASRAAYGAMLSAFYGIYAALEPALCRTTPWTALGLDPVPRQKLPLLEQDLLALGIDPARLPTCPDTPDLTSPARALGALYVLEGSTLGGKLISRELRKELALESRFFSSYGAEVGPMWRAFTQALDQFFEANEGLDEAVAAANDTFLLFERWVSLRINHR